jgi:DNA-binding Lrp family transcriptional regulator
MSEAYVLINCALGHEEDIIEELNTVSGISEVHGTFGAYDILTKVSGIDSTDMRTIITEKIRKIKHVRSTLALIVISEQDQ